MKKNKKKIIKIKRGTKRKGRKQINEREIKWK
jgi:hypothetical protein